ncbi:MAG TPA: glycosyltransferase [Solirubrobacteraceae bacterium]|nr:glycosyltransferase [Solirubrobacteraceae bacterium]
MALDGSPRVTLGIATHNRHDYLAAAVRSGLEQDFADMEVLVVLDGTTNPATEAILAELSDDARLRVVRHERNLGIAAAYNTFISAGRGELIAMLGDDDLCLPGRIRRQVEVFDRHPDTGVVHGDAIVIDADGRRTGIWPSVDLAPGALVRSLWRSHNHLVDPTRMVHRRVYQAVGGYDGAYPMANDLDLWLRAAPRFRFRHCGGAPLTAVRRHGDNASGESARERELEEVQRALEAALERTPLRELVPELDWAVLDERDAERQALLRLADLLELRRLALPELAAKLRRRAQLIPAPDWERIAATGRRASPRSRSCADDSATGEVPAGLPAAGALAERPHRLMITSFGFDDSGGGTTVPRLVAKELARRGWDVTVFCAATEPTQSRAAYEVRESRRDGVRVISVHNRDHGLFDISNPLRELDDPPITAAFERALDATGPQVVHFHNLHNLGARLIDVAAARGLPAYFTTHNYWLICPRAYLLDGDGRICPGPGDGGACAGCVGCADPGAYRLRLEEICAGAQRGLTAILAVSHAVRRTLLGAGYPAEMVDVVRQAMPHEGEIWERVGRDRSPGRVAQRLTVAFVGSAYPHKGPQLLVEAAQRTRAQLDVRILGEVPDAFARRLRERDRRGVVSLCGSFSPSELPGLLASVDAVVLPSMWWDCAPLVAAECLAARTPLLVPRLGGLPEAIRDGVDGLTFEGLDADDLATQLDRLADEPGLLERLQAAIEPPRPFGDYVDELERYYDGERPGAVADPVEGQPPTVRWQGDFGLATSLSIINERITGRLAGPVRRVSPAGSQGAAAGPQHGAAGSQGAAAGSQHGAAASQGAAAGSQGAPAPARELPHPADVEVRHQWPPDLTAPRAGRLAVILPWEFGAIPEDWIEPLQRGVDELWVPSEHVRSMYLRAGLDAKRVVVIPNGVDLELFRPRRDGEDLTGTALEAHLRPVEAATRFLFVGGLVGRKGADLLAPAWIGAFAGRDDVALIVKDFGSGGIYRSGERDAIRRHAASGALPRIVLIDEELPAAELAALYRACDVLVHPYRGEGFAMPVLEAMASALPVIVTAGGPTDEFVPEGAGWRISARRVSFAEDRIEHLQTRGTPWLLEPDLAHLVSLLREAEAAGAAARRARGAVARRAAERLSWEAVAEQYERRIASLARRRPRRCWGAGAEPFPLAGEFALRVLATPAWRGRDQLDRLLGEWARATDAGRSACLYLLADPRVDGRPEELERGILQAAQRAGVDLEHAADIEVLMEPAQAQRDPRLHAAMTAYVPLHPACAGHERMAHEAGCAVLELGTGAIGRLVGAAPLARAA